MEGILVGTLILWILNAVLVVPLTSVCLSSRMGEEGVDVNSVDQLPEDRKNYWKGVATRYYIFWDVVVLALVGFLGGILGYWFIGFSTEAKGWPGILTFILASFLGLAVHGKPI